MHTLNTRMHAADCVSGGNRVPSVVPGGANVRTVPSAVESVESAQCVCSLRCEHNSVPALGSDLHAVLDVARALSLDSVLIPDGPLSAINFRRQSLRAGAIVRLHHFTV